MARFSERMGLGPVKDAIQTDSMDDALRISLWNAVGGFYFTRIGDKDQIARDKALAALLVRVWVFFFKRPLDDQPTVWGDMKKALKDYFFACQWFEVYDFIEFVAANYPHAEINARFIAECNTILKREISAYRFVDGQLVHVTSDQEIAGIEGALKTADALQPVRHHLQRAVSLLANRTDPDCRNSMKESISAVEALCKLIAGDPKATLGSALSAIQKSGKIDLHATLKEALHKLYGYTSDADGIRHALKDAPTVDYEDALFMLTTCAAYVSYLTAKAQKAGITL